jgi:hypothetical protein
MAANAGDGEVAHFPRAPVERQGVLVRDAELVLP